MGPEVVQDFKAKDGVSDRVVVVAGREMHVNLRRATTPPLFELLLDIPPTTPTPPLVAGEPFSAQWRPAPLSGTWTVRKVVRSMDDAQTANR